jgi:hypothetical protein
MSAMFARHPRHAVHSVHAEDEPLDAMGQRFAGPPAGPPRWRRVAAMALLSAAGAIVAFMVVHGLRASVAGGLHPGVAGQAVAAPPERGAPAESAEGVSGHAPRRRARPRSSAPVRSAGRRRRWASARAVPDVVRAVAAVPAAQGVASSPQATVATRARAPGNAESEFGFER